VNLQQSMVTQTDGSEKLLMTSNEWEYFWV